MVPSVSVMQGPCQIGYSFIISGLIDYFRGGMGRIGYGDGTCFTRCAAAWGKFFRNVEIRVLCAIWKMMGIFQG